MAGLYIHIPFCSKACSYCNFHFSTNLKNKSQLIHAICKELQLQKNYLNAGSLESIYFGGGTPGLLSIEELNQLVESVYENFQVDIHAEVTIELNPDNINTSYLRGLQQLGFNRLSIGIQSFYDEDLQYMNRSHTAEKALQCLKLAQDEGFKDLNLDLIYGYPLLSDEKWLSNLNRLLTLNITHLSCYALTIEPKTLLAHQIQHSKQAQVMPEQQARQFELLMNWAAQNNYEHYEISNFCKPGHRALHNGNYWKGISYLGVGPSAHSYNGYTRQWNISNNALYIKSIEQGILPIETEVLNAREKINEYIMISLRTSDGLDLKKVKAMMTPSEFDKFMHKAKSIEKTKTIFVDEHTIYLTRSGKLLADKISVDLFL